MCYSHAYFFTGFMVKACVLWLCSTSPAVFEPDWWRHARRFADAPLVYLIPEPDCGTAEYEWAHAIRQDPK